MTFRMIVQNLLRNFNSKAIFAFLKIPRASSASVFPYKLALYLKDLKSAVFAILLLKSVASTSEKKT